ncbi:hypothetical protein NUW54_g934 [Trametes sanguinea]|uniref:Uncharacterized protein n=1 Tax=Trametes sanguinea TaxID=158606 RepID=A0ACC1QAR4_9APHY|nr:hypothetical protein NUW54_g934 [Trametes sanguinea]
MRYSRTCPRILVVHPHWLSPSARSEGVPVLRDVCIPHQRLQVESELLIFKRPSAWSAPRFLTPCEIVVPRWTFANFEEHDISWDVGVDVDECDGMEPVALGSSSNPSHTFTLYKADEVITVILFPCPVEESLEKPLHVSMSWEKLQEPAPVLPAGSQALSVAQESAGRCFCDDEHVGAWTDGEKRFTGPSEGLMLTVKLSVWDAHETNGTGIASCGLYALDLQFETLDYSQVWHP